MKFKEFSKWCNERACDGCWGMAEAITCMDAGRKVYEQPFWKRERYWHDNYEEFIVNQIVKPTNELILKYLEMGKDEILKNS